MDRRFCRIAAYIYYPIIIFVIVMGLGMLAAPPLYHYAEGKIRTAIEMGAPKEETGFTDIIGN